MMGWWMLALEAVMQEGGAVMWEGDDGAEEVGRCLFWSSRAAIDRLVVSSW